MSDRLCSKDVADLMEKRHDNLMKELFDAEVKKQVAKEKAEFLKGHTPPASKEKTGDKSYSDYKKTGNVKGMIGEKLSGLFSEE